MQIPGDNLESLYDKLVSVDIGQFDSQQRLALAGQLIDVASELDKVEGLQNAVSLLVELDQEELSPNYQAIAKYFEGNAWSALGRIRRAANDTHWSWKDHEAEQEILTFRSVITSPGFSQLQTEYKCRALTNLANTLSRLGRTVEAIELWDRALQLDADFGMAIGNRAYGLYHYGGVQYEPRFQHVLLTAAWQRLKPSLQRSDVLPNAKSTFAAAVEQIEKMLPLWHLQADLDLGAKWVSPTPPNGLIERATQWVKGQFGESVESSNGQQITADEANYRCWCLDNRLFLHPFNELGPYEAAAQDPLMLPNLVAGIDEGPRFQGFFNQLKQEFVSARYMLYLGLKDAGETHYSDKNVILLNTLDYPQYSYRLELVKSAFRSFYSLFDKIALFVNWYMELDIKEWNVKVSRFWTDNKKVKTHLSNHRNWPFRGLYWLHRDLYEPEIMGESMEPDAQDIWNIRNRLEHRYLKIHDDLLGPSVIEDSSRLPGLKDERGYSVLRGDFEQKALRLAKLARAAIIYLLLALHWEERERSDKRDGGPVPPIYLPPWDDDWKV